MRFLLVTICCFYFTTAKSQFLLPLEYDTNDIHQEYILHGTADYGFTSIRNDFSKKLLYGGYIDALTKDNSFNLHNGINRGGFEAGAEFEYRNFDMNLLKKGRGLVFKMGYGILGSILYSKDAFGLTFYGNESYLGQIADFSGSNFNLVAFQKFGVGLIDKKSKSNLTLNFYTISNYARGKLYNAGLYQSESIDSLNLLLDATIDISNTRNFVKGIGIGLDFDRRMAFELKKDRLAYIQISFRNVGFGLLPSTVRRYAVDTSYIYEGFTLDQLIGEASVLNNGTSILDTLNIQERSTSQWFMLPGSIQIGKIVDEHNTSFFQSYFGTKLYYTLAYSPLIYIGGQLRIKDKIKFGAHASYGGYAKFRIGCYANFDINTLNIGLGSEDIIGTISKVGRGQSLQFRLRCVF
jgi:hypothetical protein